MKFSTLTIENFALKFGTTMARLERDKDGKSVRDKDGFVIDKDGNKVRDFNYKNLQELVECGTCVEKIRNHPDLPDFIKVPILKLMRPLILNAQESMEDLDSVLLYLHQMLPSPIPHSTAIELVESEFFNIDELNPLISFCNKAPHFKVPGSPTIELMGQHYDLTRLSGSMFINDHPNDHLKENVESLLKMAIPVKLREVLTNVLKELDAPMENRDDFVRLIEEIKFSNVYDGIPDAAIGQKNQDMHDQSIQDCKIMMGGEDAAKDPEVEHS